MHKGGKGKENPAAGSWLFTVGSLLPTTSGFFRLFAGNCPVYCALFILRFAYFYIDNQYQSEQKGENCCSFIAQKLLTSCAL